MSRRLYIYIGFLLLIVIGLVIFEASRPKPVDWYPYYKTAKKTPFGLYVWNQEVDALLDESEVIRFSETPYNFFIDKFDTEELNYSVKGTFLYISRDFSLDNYSQQEILDFASFGNTVFLSCSDFPYDFLEDLEVELESGAWIGDTMKLLLPGSTDNEFELPVWHENQYFSLPDSSDQIKLGLRYSDTDELGVNFIRLPYGEGTVFLHLNPEVFSNYFLLEKEKREYTEYLAGYINEKTVFFYSNGNLSNENLGNTPLRFIMSKRSLKWAWLLLLITGVLFMIFRAKRRQRVIPVKIPHANTTLQFVRTVADLHYREKDYYTIMDKRIMFFLEKMRKDHRIDTREIDDRFRDKLLQVLGAAEKDVNQLYEIIKHHYNRTTATEYDVIGLNKLLEKMNL